MLKGILILFAWMGLGLSISSNAEELDVPFHPQNTVAWCWAAAIAMVGEYLTQQRAEDCQVLSAYDRLLGGPGNCCEFPLRCLRPGAPQEMAVILSNVFGLSGYHHVRPLSYAEARREIDNDRPFIAALRTGFSGHVVVISGYEEPNLIVLLDPLSGRHVVPYSQLRSNLEFGNWTETFTFSSQTSTPRPPRQSPYCCDGFGNKRCVIQVNPGPPGYPCYCNGISGVGRICE